MNLINEDSTLDGTNGYKDEGCDRHSAAILNIRTQIQCSYTISKINSSIEKNIVFYFKLEMVPF